jgi:hypothetical protein
MNPCPFCSGGLRLLFVKGHEFTRAGEARMFRGLQPLKDRRRQIYLDVPLQGY